MPKKDDRINKYIEKSADFAKPILSHIRELVHEACPQVEETMKWSFPHFDYKGMMCSVASFKEHCSVTFWKASLMNDPAQILTIGEERNGMGHLGKIKRLTELPPDEVIRAYIREACRLNDENIKLPPKPKSPPSQLVVPDDLRDALVKNDAASATFDSLSYSAKKEYTEWISEAKSDATHQKRLATTVEWLAEGKRRNWKYEKR